MCGICSIASVPWRHGSRHSSDDSARWRIGFPASKRGWTQSKNGWAEWRIEWGGCCLWSCGSPSDRACTSDAGGVGEVLPMTKFDCEKALVGHLLRDCGKYGRVEWE